MYKVIIAGSREFSDYDMLDREMNSFLKGRKKSEVEIVSGKARGADYFGEKFAENHGLELKLFPANWDIGKQAGYIRNVEMADYADACVVFMKKGGTKGSQHMIDIAKKKGMDLKVVEFVETIYKDITLTDKDIIVQQVNCRGVMGKGLALTLMNRYDNLKKEYQNFRKNMLTILESDEELLGMVHYVDTYDDKIIANVFGQVNYRVHNDEDGCVYTDKDALLEGVRKVHKYAEAMNFSVAIPTYIGCGLAGGDWNEIKPEIESIFRDSDVDVAFYHYR